MTSTPTIGSPYGQSASSDAPSGLPCWLGPSLSQVWTQPLDQLYGLSSNSRQRPAETPPSLGFPTPHAGQQAALALAAENQYTVLNWGRRSGKSTGVEQWLAEGALAGEHCAYCAPTYQSLVVPDGLWLRLRGRLAPVAVRVSEQEHSLLLRGGGSITCWSLDGDADRIRGRRYHRLAIDEAAAVPMLASIWELVLAPTLIDYQGHALIVSTPRRGSAFEEFYRRGERQEPGWAAMTITTLDNPHLSGTPRTVEEARAMGMSEQAWRQEVMADFAASESDLVLSAFRP